MLCRGGTETQISRSCNGRAHLVQPTLDGGESGVSEPAKCGACSNSHVNH